jgi:transposase
MSGNLWDGKTLAAWLKRRHGVRLGVRQCQRLFRQFGFRLRKPRPMVAQADPERQKAHKKNSKT